MRGAGSTTWPAAVRRRLRWRRCSATLATARHLVDHFHRLIRSQVADALSGWVAEAKRSMLATFGNGIAADQAAVSAALSEPWSSGATEGHITRLKLIRRQI